MRYAHHICLVNRLDERPPYRFPFQARQRLSRALQLSGRLAAALPGGFAGFVLGGPALVYDFVRTMFTDDGMVEGPARGQT